MGYYIPIFLIPIEKDAVPEALINWNSAVAIIGERWEKRTEYGLRASTARNWWHILTLSLICKGLNICGLEFLDTEIFCLEIKDLQTAEKALDNILLKIKKGIPKLSDEVEIETSILWLRTEFSNEMMRKAFEEAQPCYDIDIKDTGYEAIAGFYTFIKSLNEVVRECLDQNKYLLYIQLQP